MTFSKNVVVALIIALIISSPLTIIQVALFDTAPLDSQNVKTILGIFFMVAVFLYLINDYKFIDRHLIYVLFFIIFIVYNYVMIYLNSGATSNVNGAFLYNYSLLIFLYPFFFLVKCSPVESSKWYRWFAFSTFLFGMIGIIQFLTNSYMLPPSLVAVLLKNDYVKFDQIASHVRAMSYFKSPLEFGIYSIFASGYFLFKMIYDKRNKLINTILLIIATISVFTTISRTAILIYCVFLMLYIIFLLNDYIKERFKLKRKMILTVTAVMGSITISLFIFIYLVMVDIFLKLFPFIGDSIFLNPTNLLIRLDNWTELLIGLDSAKEWLFGQGIVQNASYGEYHSVIIDNIFIGAILTGGILGLLMFLILCYLALSEAIKVVSKMGQVQRKFGYVYISFFISFLVGGMTENLMHFMFYGFAVLSLVKVLPQTNNAAK